ncbi:MAG: hypothetical protein ABIK31_06380 [candidate division WOR-3 bacterium]
MKKDIKRLLVMLVLIASFFLLIPNLQAQSLRNKPQRHQFERTEQLVNRQRVNAAWRQRRLQRIQRRLRQLRWQKLRMLAKHRCRWQYQHHHRCCHCH